MAPLEPPSRVAFVGLGRMGVPMATNLVRAGFDVVLHNRTLSTAEEVGARTGAAVAATPAAAAAGAEAVVTMLADGDALRGVLAGPDGVLAALDGGRPVVDMGTTGPAAIAELAPLVTAAGGELVDAPVSGSVAAAANARLTIMLGASDETAARVRPMLEAMGSSVRHMGGPGAGAVAKLAVNGIIFALGNAVAESLVLAERAGIDRTSMYDLIADSAAAAPMVGYRRQAFLDPDGTPPAFALSLAAKDLRLITELAATLDLPLDQATANLAMVEDAVAAGLADRDMADVAVHLRTRSTGSASS